MTDYERFIVGQEVAIIGGSDFPDRERRRLTSWSWPGRIVRINEHVLRQGGRCDVIYHTTTSTPPISSRLFDGDFRPAWVFLNLVDYEYEGGNREEPLWSSWWHQARKRWPEVRLGHFAQGQWGRQNPYGAEHEWLNEIHNRLDAILLTGVVALAHVLRFRPARVYVTGFDLYDGAGIAGLHDLSKNARFLAELLRTFPETLVYDEPLLDGIRRRGIEVR